MLCPFSPRLRRWLTGVLAAYALLLLVALFVASFWPLPPPGIAVLNELAGLLFLPAPALLAAAVIVRARGAMALAALPFMLFAALYGGRFIPTPPASAGPRHQELVVYTANILQGRVDPGRFRALIRDVDPDIVAVQELSTGSGAVTEILGERLEYRALAPRSDFTGAGLWSRFPIVEAETLLLGGERGNLSQRVRLDVHGQIVTVYNIHLNAPVTDAWYLYDASLRRTQVERLLADIRDQRGPVLLAGDFNLTDRTYDYRRLADALTDAYVAAGSGLGLTFPSADRWGLGPLIRIDYIWTGPTVSAREVKVVDSAGSDHHGLVARITIPAAS